MENAFSTGVRTQVEALTGAPKHGKRGRGRRGDEKGGARGLILEFSPEDLGRFTLLVQAANAATGETKTVEEFATGAVRDYFDNMWNRVVNSLKGSGKKPSV